MERVFETIIIGAGPGGLTAGRYLKNALILEQKEEIGRPVQCAEGLEKRFLDHLEIKPDPSWISTTIDKNQFILANGQVINYFPQGKSYILDRTAFEKFLARQSQAEILLKKRVIDIEKEDDFWRIKTEEGEVFKSKYLVGADGPFSIVRRKVFKENIRTLPCIEYLIELERKLDISTIKIYLDREKFPGGYAWIFPKSEKRANIGLGIDGQGNLREKFSDFLEEIIKRDFGNFKILENRSGIVPWPNDKIKLEKENAFLVGDAGGLVSPIFGGGIGNAMLSGKIVAQSILSKRPNSYEKNLFNFLPYFNKDLFLAQKIFYSLDNQTLNEIGEILEKAGGDLLYLKKLSTLVNFLAKPHLRRNIFKFLKLFFIYKKMEKKFVDLK